jgi:poly(A) polymerase Pap1
MQQYAVSVYQKMFDCWTTIALVVAVCIAIYQYAVRNNDYWAKKGIAYIKPVPFLGNMANAITKKRPFAEVLLVWNNHCFS